jgi:hypothetical protein
VALQQGGSLLPSSTPLDTPRRMPVYKKINFGKNQRRFNETENEGHYDLNFVYY